MHFKAQLVSFPGRAQAGIQTDSQRDRQTDRSDHSWRPLNLRPLRAELPCEVHNRMPSRRVNGNFKPIKTAAAAVSIAAAATLRMRNEKQILINHT